MTFRPILVALGALVAALACGSVDGDGDKTKPDASLGGTSGSGGGGLGGEGGFGGQGGSAQTGGVAGDVQDAGGDVKDGGLLQEIERFCHGKAYQCGDSKDNDGDGLTDAEDPDCIGACDASELTLSGAFLDVKAPCSRDCFYDQDSGTNDQCYWDYRCDSGMVKPNYNPRPDQAATCLYDPATKVPGTSATCAELKTKQPSGCASYCGPLTPNGCDCFGCCELPSGSNKWRYLGSTDKAGVFTCTSKDFNDPEKCRPCDPVPACLNKCDSCEVCLGGQKPGAGCSKAQQCPAGVPTCGAPGEPFCPKETYCVTGCCMPVPK